MDGIVTMELPAFDTAPPGPPPNVLADEERAFARLLPELLTTHKGQYVAILGGKVVGCGADKIAVAKQAYADHGYRPILVRLITDEPQRVAILPSVFRVGRG
jgi:hypothetical protein